MYLSSTEVVFQELIAVARCMHTYIHTVCTGQLLLPVFGVSHFAGSQCEIPMQFNCGRRDSIKRLIRVYWRRTFPDSHYSSNYLTVRDVSQPCRSAPSSQLVPSLVPQNRGYRIMPCFLFFLQPWTART